MSDQSPLEDDIVHNYRKLSPADLENTFGMYLTGLMVVGTEGKYAKYELCQPALANLLAKDEDAFSRIASKVNKRLGISLPTIWQGAETFNSAAAAPRGHQAAPYAGIGVQRSVGRQADRLMVLADDVETWRTPEGEPYVTVPVNGHQEHWPLSGKVFRQCLRQRFFAKEGKVPCSQALQNALGVLEGQARFEGLEYPVSHRVAEYEGALYLDLANPSWEVVRVTPEGWQVVTNPPVKFRRPDGVLPLLRPVVGGSVEELKPFISVGSKEDWCLLLAWLVMAYRATGPFPVLLLQGGQGTAKSTTTKVLKALVDPHTEMVQGEPTERLDFKSVAGDTWCVGFDNLSSLPRWLSDLLCRLATGSGFGPFASQRPVVLNSIEELAVQGDLLDRSLMLSLPQVKKRVDERRFWQAFFQAQPRILGALLDVISVALRNLPAVELPDLPRMADLALWVTAAEPGLGWTKGTFLRVYSRDRKAASDLALEASPVAAAIQKFMARRSGPWEGNAEELLRLLTQSERQEVTKRMEWPKRSLALSNALRRLAPDLRKVGINVTFLVRKRDLRGIRVERVPNGASQSSHDPAHLAQERGSKEAPDDAGDVGDDLSPVHSPASDTGHTALVPSLSAMEEPLSSPRLALIDNKTILTETGGFLWNFTHTLNPYLGCSFARSLCGTFCYAQFQPWIVKGRPWGLYGAKRNAQETYRHDYDQLKHPRSGQPKPLRVFMSSSSDPYVPQERRLGLTQALLEEMVKRPPDVLVIQTHTTVVLRDLDLIRKLSALCELWVSITIETDMDPVPGFPPHASSPAKRLDTLKLFRDFGVRTQATLSPLLPVANLPEFARRLDESCDRIIIDHYLLGDGSLNGARTKRTKFPQMLDVAGFGEWNQLNKFWEVKDFLANYLGPERVLVSKDGFNAIGNVK